VLELGRHLGLVLVNYLLRTLIAAAVVVAGAWAVTYIWQH
jgi:hypothetical protein